MQPKSDSQNMLWIPVLKGIFLGLLFLAVFMAGFFFRDGIAVFSPGLALADPPSDYGILTEVNSLLNDHYLRELPEQQTLEYAAIRGMLTSLNDPYTFFVEPPVAQSESDVLAGQYGGIGVQVQHAADGTYVLYPFPESPAAEAGIEDGDTLLAIGDWAIDTTAQIDAIDQAMRGEVGSSVQLLVQKRSSSEPATYEIDFAVIAVPSVVWRPLIEEPRIGYIQIMRFTSRTPEELQTALQDLLAANVSGWVLDMRNNAGGLLQEAIEVGNEFLDTGVIVYEKSRENEKSYTAEADGLGVELPLIILVNHGTASAAELVAGALQDNDRGTVIGQTTYGKGSVQLIFPLPDGSSIHVTSAEWLTPNRTQLEFNGLIPDISMIPAEDGRDVELDEAIRQLQQTFQE